MGKRSRTTVRMADTEPGQVVEADFGRLELMWGPQSGRRRQAWGLVIVLGYSRHEFLWPLFSQKLKDAIEGLDACWAFWGGMPGHAKDKPKVERQVPYVRERFFKGGQFHDLSDLCQQARQWCLEVAGARGLRHHSALAAGGVRGSGSSVVNWEEP